MDDDISISNCSTISKLRFDMVFHVMEETFMRDIVALVSPALHGLAELFSYRILINGVNWERFNSGGISECI